MLSQYNKLNSPPTTGQYSPILSPYGTPQAIGGSDLLEYNAKNVLLPPESEKPWQPQEKEAGEKPYDEAIDTVLKKVKDLGPLILVGFGIWLIMQ
jgi:hypothetical protein